MWVSRYENVIILDFIAASMMVVVVTNVAVRYAKLSNCNHQQPNTQLYTGQMPFLSPNKHRQSTEIESIIFHPKLTWGFSYLSYWLP